MPDLEKPIDTKGFGAALRMVFRPLFGPPADDSAYGKADTDEAISKMKDAASSLKTVAEEVKAAHESADCDPISLAMKRLSERLGR